MTEPRRESAQFHELLATIGELHDRKQADYGRGDDPFANVRAAEQWGLPPSLGACIRIGDKVSRLQTFYRKGELANESVEDAYMDLAVYALIGLLLYRQESETAIATRPATRPSRCEERGVGAWDADLGRCELTYGHSGDRHRNGACEWPV